MRCIWRGRKARRRERTDGTCWADAGRGGALRPCLKQGQGGGRQGADGQTGSKSRIVKKQAMLSFYHGLCLSGKAMVLVPPCRVTDHLSAS